MIDALVGRDAVVAEGLAALEARRPLLLFGPEGIGKSRLAAEFAERLAPQRSRRFAVRATPEHSGTPFGALLHVIGPELLSDAGPASVQKVAAQIRGSSAVVVVFDDVEYLDRSSLAVLQLLSEYTTPRLILTSRADEMPPTFRRMVRDRNALAIALSPLDEPSVQVLLERTAGKPLSAASTVRLFKLTSGIPLHAIELVRAGLAANSFDLSGGKLSLNRPLPSTDLRALVGHRVSELSTDNRRALELVALGEPIEPAIVVALTSADAVSSLMERGLVGERGAERQQQSTMLYTSYPLIAEMVLANIPAFRRSMHLLDLADALAQQGRGTPDELARQLLWTHGAGLDVSADTLASTATQVSLRRLQGFIAAITSEPTSAESGDDGARLLASSLRDRYEEARQLASYAYEQEPTVTNGFGLLRVLMSSDEDLDRAGEVIDQLRAQSLNRDQDAELRRVGRIVHAYHRGDSERASEVVAGLPVPAGNESVVELEAAVVELYTGDVDVAAERLASVVTQGADRTFLSAVALLELSVARTLQGRPTDAAGLADSALPIAMSGGAEASFIASLWWIKSLATAFDGRIPEAESMLLSAFNASVSADSVEGAGFFADGLATVARISGRYRTAARRARRSSDLLTIRDVGQLTHALGEWGVSLCWLGEPATARRAFDRMRENRNRRPTARAAQTLLRFHLEANEGRQLTTSYLNEMFDDLSGISRQTCVDLVWFAATNRAADWAVQRAAELRLSVQGSLNHLYLDAADALAGGSAETCHDVVKRAIDMQVPGVAWVMASAAAHLLPAAQASAFRTIAVEQHRLTEGARLLLSGGPSELTRRERSVASLASQGWTDAAIAAHLGLSVRTVESHLSRVYRKLNVHTRRELSGLTDVLR